MFNFILVTLYCMFERFLITLEDFFYLKNIFLPFRLPSEEDHFHPVDPMKTLVRRAKLAMHNKITENPSRYRISFTPAYTNNEIISRKNTKPKRHYLPPKYYLRFI